MCLDESTELSVTGGLETDTVGPLPAAGDTSRWPQITTKIIIISMSSSAAAPLLSYFDDPEN